MRIWGIHKKYKGLSWTENFMGGYLRLGPITIWGANAMNWVVNIETNKFGVICFTLPVFSNLNRMYFYFSPNGTPWASTYYIGYDKSEKIKAKLRKKYLGHNFNTNLAYRINQFIIKDLNIRTYLMWKDFRKRYYFK